MKPLFLAGQILSVFSGRDWVFSSTPFLFSRASTALKSLQRGFTRIATPPCGRGPTPKPDPYFFSCSGPKIFFSPRGADDLYPSPFFSLSRLPLCVFSLFFCPCGKDVSSTWLPEGGAGMYPASFLWRAPSLLPEPSLPPITLFCSTLFNKSLAPHAVEAVAPHFVLVGWAG